MSKVAKIVGGAFFGTLTVLTFGLNLPVFGPLIEAIATTTGLGALASGMIAGGLIGAGAGLLKPKVPTLSSEFGLELQLNGDPIAARKIYYGEVWTARVLRYRGATGTNNKYLYMVVILAGHGPDEIQ